MSHTQWSERLANCSRMSGRRSRTLQRRTAPPLQGGCAELWPGPYNRQGACDIVDGTYTADWRGASLDLRMKGEYVYIEHTR